MLNVDANTIRIKNERFRINNLGHFLKTKRLNIEAYHQTVKNKTNKLILGRLVIAESGKKIHRTS